MATAEYITQPPGVGSRRQLTDVEKEHVICLLRAIERLPLLSQPAVDALCSSGTLEELKRCLEGIHRNHLELSQCASVVLIDHRDDDASRQ